MTALLIASAPEPDLSYVKRLAQQADLVVCADGGLRHAKACGIVPDLVIGDFDSGNRPEGVRTITLKPEKDDSDLMCCTRTMLREGADEIWLCCASGGRIDHFLSNLSLLEYLDEHGARGVFYDSVNRVTFHGGGSKTYRTDPHYQYLGIVPLDAVLKGVTLRGLKYELDGADVTRSFPITISNEPTADTFTVEIREGSAYVVESNG